MLVVKFVSHVFLSHDGLFGLEYFLTRLDNDIFTKLHILPEHIQLLYHSLLILNKFAPILLSKFDLHLITF